MKISHVATRRRCTIVIALIFLASLTVCPLLTQASEGREIILLHTNDIHGHLLAFDAGGSVAGGFDRLIGQVQALREEYPGRVLWLDGGDTWHGTNLANFVLGESVVDLLNVGGLDAMVLGNHDFNYGQSVLRERVAQAAFPVLSANVLTQEGERLAGSTALFQLDGVTVGVLGLTTPDTPVTTHWRNVQGLTFLDPVEVAREFVPRLQEEADLVVVLSHLGIDREMALAEAVSGIDVIVGGHSHTLLAATVQAGETLIVQANEWGKYLGVLRLTVADGEIVAHEGRLIPITPDLPRDQAVVQRLEEWETSLSERFDVVVGATRVHLDGEREQVRMMETNLGNLIADIVRETASAEVALVNGGAIRASVRPGPITLGTIYEILPFENTVYGVLLSGRQLLAALENGVSYYSQGSGRFLQVSGLRFSFDPDAPVGQRVKDVHIGVHPGDPEGAPLDLDRIYRVAVTDFMAQGGDEFAMLVDAPRYYGANAQGGMRLAELLRDHLAVASPLEPKLEGRITILDNEQ